MVTKEQKRAANRAWYTANRERAIANAKAWRIANPDRVHAYSKASAKAWQDANKERTRATTKAWWAANPERCRVLNKAWYAANKERARANAKAWAAANPERKRAYVERRRARIASVLATLTPQEWEAILEAAGRACIYCGGNERLTQDHLTPLTRGGPHTAENVAPACKPCNSSKGARTVMEFLAEK